MSKTHGPRAPSQRQLRVGEEVRHVLSALFRRGDFRDPALQSLNVTVTEVRLSPDLRNATVFVTPLGGQHLGDAVAALRRASAFLRGQVARELQLRFAPALSFEADVSFDIATRIDTLLHLPEVVRDLHPPDDAPKDDTRKDDAPEGDDGEVPGRPDGGA